MEQRELISKYLTWFYFFGQCLYNPRANTDRIRTISKFQLFRFVPTILRLILIVTVSTLGLKSHLHLTYRSKLGQATPFFGTFFISAQFLTNFLVVVHSILYRNSINRLLNQFQIIENLFRQKLSENITYDRLHERYKCSTILCFGSYLLGVAAMVSTNLLGRGTDYRTAINVYSLVFMNLCSLLYVKFFVYLQNYFLTMLNESAELITVGPLSISNMWAQVKGDRENFLVGHLKYLKYMHFKLVFVTQLLNQFFGWILLAVCLNNFFDLVHSIYWVYLLLQSIPSGYYYVARKFCHSFGCAYFH